MVECPWVQFLLRQIDTNQSFVKEAFYLKWPMLYSYYNASIPFVFIVIFEDVKIASLLLFSLL